MRFHVVGVGTLGTLVAHHLRRATPATHPIVLLYDRRKHMRQGPEALHVQSLGSITTSSGFEHETYTNARSTIESLFVTTRANSTLYAIEQLAPRLSANSTIVLVQNGLAVYDRLTQTVFRDPHQRPHFIFASTTHLALFQSAQGLETGGHVLLRPADGNIEFGIMPDPLGRNFEAGFEDEVLHPSERSARLSDIGAESGDPSFERYRSLRNTVAALLLAEALNARWRPISKLQLDLRRKLAINSVIHPLTALLGCRTADVFATAGSIRIAERISREASEVFGAQLREETKEWLRSAQEVGEVGGLLGIARLPRALEPHSLVRECLAVSHTSKGTISSMLAALRKGKETEIDFLNGYLAKLGRTYNVQTPTIATMYDLVKLRSTIALDQIL
ncbi:ketopantoate reductase PanE/ApbA C terminal-domain-containing protein [Mycena capillaripes]|nr:ketopantoate reductase PanE/ApbA C terminal-domain-containing protein [Mycena capillaripes]